ncbi:steryl-sulfatase [Xyrauchen texanus]|uniref:steryl-sulfatase n=1 Tax=Xyrauchen texanus TaxID=154827 RepID=UPI0022428BE1|nr:steryl-sulfatase [Xyrauchen texanus]
MTTEVVYEYLHMFTTTEVVSESLSVPKTTEVVTKTLVMFTTTKVNIILYSPRDNNSKGDESDIADNGVFFLFIQVHTTLFASPPFRGRSKHGIHGDAVMEMDWSVGQIKLKENTKVFLTSDQWPHLEKIPIHGEVHRGCSGIYKAGKSNNSGIQVPEILHWPGGVHVGKVIDEPSSNMDLFPTVLKLVVTSEPSDR